MMQYTVSTMGAKHIKPEDYTVMIKAYQGGSTLKESAALFGRHYTTLLRELQKRGIPRRGDIAHRKYAMDETFFDYIDSEDKAYFLGLFSADGSVNDRAAIVLNLKVGDIGIVRQFKEAVKSEHPVKVYDTNSNFGPGREARLYMTSKRMAASLHLLGVVPRKSKVLRPCKQVPGNLLRHYWRGFIDGDGCITETSVTLKGVQYPQWNLSLIGSKWIAVGFREFLASQGIRSKARIRHTCSGHSIAYGGISLPQLVGHILYDDAIFYLARKKAKVDELLAAVPKQVRWHNIATPALLARLGIST